MALLVPDATMSALRMTLAIVAALAGLGVTVALGNWQLRRAAEKIAIEQEWQAAQRAPPVQLRSDSDLASVAAALPRRVRAHGTFEYEHTIWLDNRARGGRAGFFVVTPLRVQGTPTRLLVNRGWAPRDPAERTHLPSVGQPQGVVDVEGMAVQTVPRVFQFAGDEAGPIRQNADVGALQREIGTPLAGFVLQQTSELDDALDRHWAAPASGVERHRGYAFQWFSLAALLSAIVAGLGWRALRRRNVSEGAA